MPPQKTQLFFRGSDNHYKELVPKDLIATKGVHQHL